jgi:hypothetical protein
MKTENKIFIRTFLFTGFGYAGLMAGFDYLDGESFRQFKHLFHFLFFGLCMGLLARYSYKKQFKKEINEIENTKTDPKL